MRIALVLACVSLTVAPLRVHAAPKATKAADRAAEADLERLELARQHFQRGETLAAVGKLDEAMVEYELSEVAHASPSVTEAKAKLAARIMAQRAPAPVAVVELAPAPQPPQRAPLGRFVAPIVIAPFALGALVAGGAVLGTERHDYDHLSSTCAPACAPSSYSSLKTREEVGYALLGVGAGLAVLDVALWGVLATQHRERPPTQASLEPSVTGIRGRF